MPINLGLPPSPQMDRSLLSYLNVFSQRIQTAFRQASTIPPSCKVYRTANQLFPAGSFVEILFNAELWKTDSGMHSNSVNTGRLIAPERGIYGVAWYQRLGGGLTSTAHYTVQRLYCNGVMVSETLYPHNVTGYVEGNGFDQINMNAGDYVQTYVWNNLGVTQIDIGAVPTFSITKIADW